MFVVLLERMLVAVLTLRSPVTQPPHWELRWWLEGVMGGRGDQQRLAPVLVAASAVGVVVELGDCACIKHSTCCTEIDNSIGTCPQPFRK